MPRLVDRVCVMFPSHREAVGGSRLAPVPMFRCNASAYSTALPPPRVALFVQPDVFHAAAIEETVDHYGDDEVVVEHDEVVEHPRG